MEDEQSCPSSGGQRSTLKIAIWQNLPSGGAKRALHDHVKGLVARGHSVESWSPPTADLTYLPLSPYGAEHVVPLDESPAPQGNRISRRWQAYRETIARIEAMKQHARRCVEEIEARDFDVIFANTCRTFASPFLGRFANIPTVLYLQDPFRGYYEAGLSRDGNRLVWVADEPKTLRSRFFLTRWKEWAGWGVQDLADVQSIRARAREEALNVHAFGLGLCNSRFSRESFLRIYGRDFRVCYLGVDLDSFRPSEVPKERFVVGLGSFGSNKGIDVAIRAIGTIDASKRPDLVWIGNFVADAYYHDVVELATRLGVNFIPRKLVPQDELTALLGRAAVMIYTSRLEPFGYAPLEANACGTSVVGVAEGGIRETIEPGINGQLVDDAEPEALGRAISRYTDDLEFARLEGIKAYEHVTKNWQIGPAIDRLENYLKQVVESNAQR